MTQALYLAINAKHLLLFNPVTSVMYICYKLRILARLIIAGTWIMQVSVILLLNVTTS